MFLCNTQIDPLVFCHYLWMLKFVGRKKFIIFFMFFVCWFLFYFSFTKIKIQSSIVRDWFDFLREKIHFFCMFFFSYIWLKCYKLKAKYYKEMRILVGIHDDHNLNIWFICFLDDVLEFFILAEWFDIIGIGIHIWCNANFIVNFHIFFIFLILINGY